MSEQVIKRKILAERESRGDHISLVWEQFENGTDNTVVVVENPDLEVVVRHEVAPDRALDEFYHIYAKTGEIALAAV